MATFNRVFISIKIKAAHESLSAEIAILYLSAVWTSQLEKR
jgi:hypothetical protein